MSDEPKSESQKIIIDEDWKSRVQAEKEAVSGQKQSPKQETDSAPAGPPPAPTLTDLAGGLYMQGLIELGLLPPPGSDKPEVRLEHARHAVDTLQMLEQKTEGNRTPEESKELGTMLHELRLAYVAVGEKQKEKP